MNRSVLIGFVFVGILLVWVAPRLPPPVYGQAASAQAPHIGEGGLPQFEKEFHAYLDRMQPDGTVRPN